VTIAPEPLRGEYVPQAFADRILLHVCRNQVPALEPPLILAVQGPMGCGKSWQTRRVCARKRIPVVSISGSELSGQHEKASVEVLHDAYTRAATADPERPSVLLIDDFHLSSASTFANREYTVNSQLLVGALMNLADDPTQCGQLKLRRTAIIVTGNDFTALYGPLTRYGRMDFFDWQPTADDKFHVVQALFQQVLGEARDEGARALVDRFPNESVAFFASVRTRLYDAVILRWLAAGELKFKLLEQQVRAIGHFTPAEVLKQADELRASRPRDFIAGCDTRTEG